MIKSITGKPFLLFLLLSCVVISLFGQSGVGINPTGAPANSSAGLDVDFNNKGMLVPRLTDAERNAISNPANGLLIFNISTNCFNFYRSNLWYELCGNCIIPNPPVASNGGNICAGDTIFLLSTNVPGAVFSWTGPNAFSSSQQNPVILNAGTNYSGTYSVVATVNGCSSTPATTAVVVNAIPSSSFTSNPVQPNPNQACTFSPVTTGASYNWTFQGGIPAGSTLQNPVVQWGSVGTYDVTLTVTLNGCSSTTTIPVTVTTCGGSGTTTFSYTGAMQTWTVPVCITSINVECSGAQGGSGYAGNTNYGGKASATLTVTPGETLYIYVGGKPSGTAAGWNGGGGGETAGYGGGGGSDIRRGGTTYNDRIIVGGGGGGGSYWSGEEVVGGKGGGLTGEEGYRGSISNPGGQGGTQTSSGTGTCINFNLPSMSGGFGFGGSPVGHGCGCDGYGGGGGWYGGAGSGNCRGGGGGSNYVIPAGSTNVVHTRGAQVGNGQIIITW